MNCKIFKTQLGWVGVAVSGQGISKIVLPRPSKRAVEREIADFGLRIAECEAKSDRALLKKAVSLLRKYFSGKDVSFDLPLDTRYYTPFQQAVWNACARIPYGETRSYGWIAKRIKRPNASRAVGQAMGANPVPLLVPCHRVVGSAGSLGGFAGGIELKKKLLELEVKRTSPQRTQRSPRRTVSKVNR